MNQPSVLRAAFPSRHVTSPKFRYVSAAHTDVRRTWRKFRLLMRLQKAAA